LSAAAHTVSGKVSRRVQFATWVCRKIYDLRNDFLHGNDVEPSALLLNQMAIIDLAACLYRLMLTGFLDLRFNVPKPQTNDTEEIADFISQRMDFNRFQGAYEEALLTAI
jgi:hypothetical protein